MVLHYSITMIKDFLCTFFFPEWDLNVQTGIGICRKFIDAEKCCIESLHDNGFVTEPNLFHLENALLNVHSSGLSTGLLYCTAFLIDDRLLYFKVYIVNCTIPLATWNNKI